MYYSVASVVRTLPPLRQRLDDVLPLVDYFLRQLHPHGAPPQLDAAVRTYLLTQDYPGNVRDLRQVVARLLARYAGGMLSMGSMTPEERPTGGHDPAVGLAADFESVVRRAVMVGVQHKDISRAADAAIYIATDEESRNLQRAARRLGVTDRTLQLRGAQRRHVEEN
jgi:DNA-binding NtrC family response regulator